MVDIVKRGRLIDEDEEIAEFTSGFEEYWYEPHLWVDEAHVTMLTEQGIIPVEDGVEILNTLERIAGDGFESLPERGDLHVAIEEEVIRTLGEDVGGRMHTGRSRNDKGATAHRVAVRWDLLELACAILELRQVLLGRAEEMSDWLMSGYTHLQNAQPTTIGHHLMGHAERMRRDFERIVEAYERTNHNPLGSAAFAGTGYDIDRDRTTVLLGFDEPSRNSMDAVSSRDFIIDAQATAACVGTNVSSICEEIYIWTSSEFEFMELDDAHAGSSSIMPQKKNPDAAELARARAGTINGQLTATLALLKGLPMAFNMDLVQTALNGKEALATAVQNTRIIATNIRDATFERDRLEEGTTGGFSTATELADTLVRSGDIPFRTAHHIVGRIARDHEADEISPEVVNEVAIKIRDEPLRLDQDEIDRAMDPRHNVEMRNSYGGPGEIQTALADAGASLETQRDQLRRFEEELADARDRLTDAKAALAD